jgi:acyl transferase domain-containing protein/NADP-dependent 3-hydroxy acid dehydrogenase YdfG/acyl carrier protein
MSAEWTPAPPDDLPEPIAVIGMACRFPGAKDCFDFWRNLDSGVSSVVQIPAMRWDRDKYYSSDPETPDASVSKWGGFIDDIDRFDAGFFKISRREAELMDPQQRIMLELAWNCMEDAGYAPSRLRGSATGVYVGVCNFDYKELLEKLPTPIEGHLSTGTYCALIPNRISYEFDLRGPSMPIDTACSSSLVALHEAVHALRRGECSAALVGGVSLLCSPTYYVAFSKTGMLSPDGACKTFDTAANGYVRGEGAGLIMLKPLRQALADGDRICGLIRGTAVNHGGRVQTVTSPSAFAQAKVIVDAYQRSGTSPANVSYIEAHGTGTPKGDPIEINGLRRAFAALEKQFGAQLAPRSCAIGSVKTNIGHLEAAAGIAGIIKTLLAMRHRRLPGLLHFKRLNPRISLEGSPFYILEQSQEWMPVASGMPLCAGVSSFGFGGVNAHAVLEEYRCQQAASAPLSRSLPFVISARTKESLRDYSRNLARHLRANPGLPLPAVLRTMFRREAMEERLALFVDSIAELSACLDADMENPGRGYRGRSARDNDTAASAEPPSQRAGKDVIGENASDSRTLAQNWVNGTSVDWDAMCAPDVGMVSLPSYPFADKRYWIPAATQARGQIAAELWRVAPQWDPALLAPADKYQALAATETCLLLAALAPVDQEALLSLLPDGYCVLLPVPEEAAGADRWIGAFTEGMAVLRDAITRCRPSRCVLFSGVDPAYTAMMEGALRSVEKELGLPFASYAWDVNEVQITPARLYPLLHHAGAAHGTGRAFRVRNRQDRMAIEARRWVCSALEGGSAGIARGAVYWITGGNGALGRQVAKLLAEKYGATVILSGRSATAAADEQILGEGRILFRSADCTDRDQMLATREWIVRSYGKLSGVIHAAGVIRDKSLFSKTAADIDAVMRPKIEGVMLLDEVTRDCMLEHFVVFSSLSGVFGNTGQMDYAAANAFLRQFVIARQQRVAAGKCTGASLAVHWPYWEEGGMCLDAAQLVALTETMGTKALPSSVGLVAFEAVMSAPAPDNCLVYGMRVDIEAVLNRTDAASTTAAKVAADTPAVVATTDVAVVRRTVATILAELTRTDLGELRPNQHFSDFGIDSILLQSFIKRINTAFGLNLPTVRFHSHPTIAELSDVIVEDNGAPHPAPAPTSRRSAAAPSVSDVAVIGISLQVPGARTLEQFWDLLMGEERRAVPYPAQRWEMLPVEMTADSSRQQYQGLFLDNIAAFDHRLFGISPREAMLMDPQQRLLLHSLWQAIEDAGYTRQEFARKSTSLLLSIDAVDYDEVVRHDPQVDEFSASGLSRYIAANRLSHFFDLRGVSEPVNTACSSFFVGLERATEALRKGRCGQAVVSAVQLNIAPSRFRLLGQKGLLSAAGRTAPFDCDADGFIRSEGVGTVILKKLDDALADNDHIYGVIKGAGVWHAGRAISVTAPNAAGHREAMRIALDESGVDANRIAYIEAHGTGMALGDSSELSAFSEIMRTSRHEQPVCIVGAAKSVLGHMEAASGAAAFVKVLLALKKRCVPGVAGLRRPHPDLQLSGMQLGPLPQMLDANEVHGPAPCAGLHSYGLGGVSAFVVVEGYRSSLPADRPPPAVPIFVLSALSVSVLRVYLERVRDFLIECKTSGKRLDFDQMLATYQLHREHMRCRVAIVAHDANMLLDRVDQVLHGEYGEHAYRSEDRQNDEQTDQATAAAWFAAGNWDALASSWAAGCEPPWPDGGYCRHPFPAYPFDLQRQFWINHDGAP